jgi:hypothetical protein
MFHVTGETPPETGWMLVTVVSESYDSSKRDKRTAEYCDKCWLLSPLSSFLQNSSSTITFSEAPPPPPLPDIPAEPARPPAKRGRSPRIQPMDPGSAELLAALEK